VEDITKTELKKIINDEFEKLIKDVFKSKKHKDAVKDLIRDSFGNFYKTLYLKKNIWNKEL
jgi:hypothetical protein